MTSDLTQAQEVIARCLALRAASRPEAVLRSQFLSALRVIFPDAEDKGWIDHYVEGTEAHTKIAKAGGGTAARFIDNLVGSTTIEYEADLRHVFKREEGYRQVREHAAGLIREGVRPSQVRGILSDTIEWYAYDAEVPPGLDLKACKIEDVTLVPVDELLLADDSAISADRLVQFVRKHFARERSRRLAAEFLALDLGLGSGAYKRHAKPLSDLTDSCRSSDPSIAVATELWSQFIDHVEGESGALRVEAYIDEAYVSILARLFSANVLARRAILSDDSELAAILDGSHFRARYNLENMVERDYFGWLVQPEYINSLLPIAREIQRDLCAYDFSRADEQDLFGRLMAQLARKSQRKLLGQEWTPAWLAKLLAERCLEKLPPGEPPRIVDMCCGSGSILAEVLKAARERFKLSGIAALHDVATGFDIDPLAVTLAKTTWVTTLVGEITVNTVPMTIPIYHADSLFAVTPVSATIPLVGEDTPIDVSLDGKVIKLPHALVQPEYRDLFDRIVDWAYDEAIDARARGTPSEITKAVAETFVTGAAAALRLEPPADLRDALCDSAHALAVRMAELAIANRNGIWAFVLRNTYRPGLLSGQFNGLVSNPPWLAMSGLADNPYRGMLTHRAKLYGVRPSGQSFLHLELGTMHLLHAVDRYLKVGASIACLVPGSILNGHHHEPLRRREFLRAKRPVAMEITEVWQIAPGTFKYPGAAIIGMRRAATADIKGEIAGGYASRDGLEPLDFAVQSIGDDRSAWLLRKEGQPVLALTTRDMPDQGADLMPRAAVCVDILSEEGAEWRVETPKKESEWGFTLKAAKELAGDNFPGHVAPRYIHRIAQSENLLPFLLGDHRAPIAIPATRTADGGWKIFDDAEIRRDGFTHTARRFGAINKRLAAIGKGKTIQARVDERGKLTKQRFPSSGHLVLSGAGGKHICAACLPVEEAKALAIDQTLYWQVFADADAAWYFTGLLNSYAMTEAISPFNPKGDFGERHVHTLPYKLMPTFDSSNDDHMEISKLAKTVAAEVQALVKKEPALGDPKRALPARRRKLREHIQTMPAFRELEKLCASALGTTAFGGGEAEGSLLDA
jgi:SAM-dependent methyltransferase